MTLPPTTWSTLLRHTSLNTSRRTSFLQPSTISVRWASIVPYSVNEHNHFCPPPPPMTLEQAQQHVQRKQQSILEEQVQLEQRQRLRQQQELQIQLAKHRNAILEQQQQQQKALQDELEEFRSRQKQEKEQEKQLQQDQQQQLEQQVENTQQQMAQSRRDQNGDVAQNDSVEMNALHEKESTKDSTTSNLRYIPMRSRSIFGYRGPANEEQDHHTKESTPIVVAVRPVTKISEMISAENRVRLTLLDYTPKQINAMSPVQAEAILTSKQQEQPSLQTDSIESFSEKGEKEYDQAEYYSLDITPFVSGSVNSNMQCDGIDQDKYSIHVTDVLSPASHDPSIVVIPSRRASSS